MAESRYEYQYQTLTSLEEVNQLGGQGWSLHSWRIEQVAVKRAVGVPSYDNQIVYMMVRSKYFPVVEETT